MAVMIISPNFTSLQVLLVSQFRGYRSAVILCVAPHSQSFHTFCFIRKDLYQFYDLLAKQPRSSFDPSQFSFNNGHLSSSDRVKKLFGQLGSRQDRRLEAQRHAISIAGLKLSPRPLQPTNCCMSGCVNCVWELYKDELAEWKEKRAEIKRKLLFEQRDLEWPVQVLGPEPEGRQSGHTAGDRAKLEAKIEADKNADDDLDVGIKAFLKMEKRLKANRKATQQEQQQQRMNT